MDSRKKQWACIVALQQDIANAAQNKEWDLLRGLLLNQDDKLKQFFAEQGSAAYWQDLIAETKDLMDKDKEIIEQLKLQQGELAAQVLNLKQKRDEGNKYQQINDLT